MIMNFKVIKNLLNFSVQMDQITNVFVIWDGLVWIAVLIVAVMDILSVIPKLDSVIFAKKIPVVNFANFVLREVLEMLLLALGAKNVFVISMKMCQQEFVIKILVNVFVKTIPKDFIVNNVWKVSNLESCWSLRFHFF